MQKALAWLAENYREAASEAYFEGFFGELSEEEQDSLDLLPDGLQGMIRINSGEWMLADGELMLGGKSHRVIDLVLGTGGPLLPARGREWLLALGEFSMSLYEVRETTPGEGMQVADLLDPGAPPVWVRERSASQGLVRWDVFGARLARQDGTWVFSGALYPFERQDGLVCRDEILAVLKKKKLCAEDRRSLVGVSLIDNWLTGLIAPDDEPPPRLVDAATGDELLLTTDRYRVTDWPALEKILAAQNDVDGDRHEGWNRFVELEDGRCRNLATLEAKGKDSLEVFCRTPQLADQARAWLEQLVGGSVTYKIREVVDPRSAKSRAAAKPASEPDIPKELQRQLMHQYLAQHYATWPEIPLPALKGKTPQQAVQDRKLRPEVLELLKSMEQLEARRVRQTGGEAFDVGFLWQRLGLERS
ncbi:MAG TPA: hypothetical protein DEB35_08310 [Desulfuromonas sp.]|nr:hypothetical protein [Desulfuromonas sp.]